MNWISIKDRMPEDLKPVNVVWVNRKPEPYYANIIDKPFVATAIYFKGQWNWWSCTAEDLLAEYGKSMADKMDKSIEILFWMPLPEPPEVEE